MAPKMISCCLTTPEVPGEYPKRSIQREQARIWTMRVLLLKLASDWTPPKMRPLARRLSGREPEPASYQGATSIHGTHQLHQGRFAEIFNRYHVLDPNMGENTLRMRAYFTASFASYAVKTSGDLAFIGVSHGITARVVFDYAEGASSRSFHFVDPFVGVIAKDDLHVRAAYNVDAEFVRRQYQALALVQIHRGFVPASVCLRRDIREGALALDLLVGPRFGSPALPECCWGRPAKRQCTDAPHFLHSADRAFRSVR
jgi:hypothetical protein